MHDEMAKRRGFRSCRKAGMRNKGHGITSQSQRMTADSRKQHVRAACIRLVLRGGEEEEVVRLFLLTAFPVILCDSFSHSVHVHDNNDNSTP